MSPKKRTRALKLLLAVFAALFVLCLLASCRSARRARGGLGAARGASPGAAVLCPLDGAPTTTDALARRPLAVMIENSPQARPQSGLADACVVYEGITEGGITRFMAIYLHGDPAEIGPVRSTRPHFINLAREYGAALVHCGESIEAEQILEEDPGVYNVDELSYPRPFWRERSRHTPHNLYTSASKLRDFLQKQGWEGAAALPTFTRGGGFIISQPAHTIDISFGGAVHYRLRLEHDPVSGGYRRYMDGKLHVDRETGAPIIARNVIIQRVSAAPFADSALGTYDVRVADNGGGYFVTGGQYTELQWWKDSDGSRTFFTDITGGPLPFQAGQTWVELMPRTGRVIIDGPVTAPGRLDRARRSSYNAHEAPVAQ